jgi:hypothetical protein
MRGPVYMKRIIITYILLFINLLSALDRERVIIANNTVKTAEGNMLRGEVRLAMEYQPWRDMCTKVEYYEDLRDNYNLFLKDQKVTKKSSGEINSSGSSRTRTVFRRLKNLKLYLRC